MKNDMREPLSPGLQAEASALSSMPDESIDFSDIPARRFTADAVQGRFARAARMANGPDTVTAGASRRIALPPPVARIYEAVAELEATYGRKFTPDGHMVGSIGEVIAADAFKLDLYGMSRPGHDARDHLHHRDVQIKLTAGTSISMYSEAEWLLVLRVLSPREAEVVYDGPGGPAWKAAGAPGKNGQSVVSLAALRKLEGSRAA